MFLRVLERGGAWVRRLCGLFTARYRTTPIVEAKYSDLVRPLVGVSADEAVEAARLAGWAERPVLDVQMIRDCLPEGDHTVWIAALHGDAEPSWCFQSQSAPPPGLASHDLIVSSTVESRRRE
jgi:hypothetical protein